MYRNFKEAFKGIGVPYNRAMQEIMRNLLEHGYLERGICYAIWQEREELKEAYGKGTITAKGTYELHVKGGLKRYKVEMAAEEEERQSNFNEVLIDAIMDWAHIEPEKTLLDLAEPGYVYFIQGVHGGPIKIGYSNNLKRRLSVLQTSYPDKLHIIAYIPATQKFEHKLHKDLKRHRLYGEWFSPTPEVLQVISEVDKSLFYADYLDKKAVAH